MGITDAKGLPIGLCLESASRHEIKLVEKTIESVYAPYLSPRLIGDKAYDSDRLDPVIEEKYGVELIAPHKKNRKAPATQDGRKLRRYKKRWKVERCFAWIQNYRKLVTRYERKAENFLGMVKLAAILILIRHL